MKYYLNNILVVEGKEDVSYLSSFLDAEFVTTNGYDIPEEEIEYFKRGKSKGNNYTKWTNEYFPKMVKWKI